MSEEQLVKVETLKIMLTSQATGGSADAFEYNKIRRELIASSHLSHLLPRFIKTCRTPSEFWQFIKDKFGTYAERREFLRLEFDPLLTMLEMQSRTPSDEVITATVMNVNSAYIQEVWHKALERRATDTEGAITAARTLLETVCKHILDESETDYDDAADLSKLYSLTAKQLNLSPSQHTEQLFKQILGGCQTIVEGLGAMRNRHSDAHGRSSTVTRAAPRHAELAVNLAGTMAIFLLQTWEARKS